MGMIVLRTLLVSQPTTITDDQGEPWVSGFAKLPVSGQVELRQDHLAGDGQADRTVHGGPEKALLGYCGDHYAQWSSELGQPFADGAFGENLALTGIAEDGVAIGDSFQLGTAVIQVSQPRQPCWKLARRNRRPDLPAKAIASGRLGWYFRVLTPGVIQAGDNLEPLARPHPEWTIGRINRLFFGPAAAAGSLLSEAATLPAMSPEFLPVCRRRLGLGA
jgi:MOSC domain-containing protein YiiM